MKKFFYSVVSVLLGVVAVTSLLNIFGVSIEAVPVLGDLMNFLSIGALGGVSLAAVTAGPGSSEITATNTGEPTGTTVVSGNVTATGAGGADVYNEAGYLEEDLNKVLVNVRPQDTPLDTLTRNIGNIKKSESWEAGGWEVGVREIKDTIKTAYVAGTSTANVLDVNNPDMWRPGDSFIIHAYSSSADQGPMLDGGSPSLPVQCLIKSISGSNLTVQRVGALNSTLPSIAKDYILYRHSPAVSELEASVEGFALQPSDRKYYNQIHMCQVEESVVHDLLKKKVAMDFGVYKEQTIWDFKRGMEYANLFQYGGLSKNAKGEPVHAATGIWWQMDRQSTINYATSMTDQIWNGIGKDIFDGNNGADRRLLFAGSDLLNQIANASSYQKQLEAKNTELVLGLRVFRIETPFGELLVKPMGSLFPGYYSKCGIVLDPNYLTKYVMEPLTATSLELDKTGQRRVKSAVRIHETYSLFLENLPCHRKIVPA